MLGVLVLAAMAELVDLVDPMIGAVTYPESGLRGDESIHGFGKTFPGAATPFGMVQLSPDTVTGGDNGPGYSYTHGTIEGFSFFHISGTGWYGEFGNFLVMPGDVPKSIEPPPVILASVLSELEKFMWNAAGLPLLPIVSVFPAASEMLPFMSSRTSEPTVLSSVTDREPVVRAMSVAPADAKST